MFGNNENRSFFMTEKDAQTYSVAKTFMANVFLWMTIAMAVTAITAYMFNASDVLKQSLSYTEGMTRRMTALGWIVTLAPIGFVLLMSFGFQRLSAPVLTLLFLTFSLLMGMSLSFILDIYTSASVFKTFIVTAGMFGTMAVLGYTTKTDLTRFGSIMMMGLFGIIIAMIVNYFIGNEFMDYVISVIGVLVFTGLTAYDVQRLKKIGSTAGEMGAENARKVGIMGALTLYLDFINLFLFLLRFLGNRK
jgi:uncharacterized protein